MASTRRAEQYLRQKNLLSTRSGGSKPSMKKILFSKIIIIKSKVANLVHEGCKYQHLGISCIFYSTYVIVLWYNPVSMLSVLYILVYLFCCLCVVCSIFSTFPCIIKRGLHKLCSHCKNRAKSCHLVTNKCVQPCYLQNPICKDIIFNKVGAPPRQ